MKIKLLKNTFASGKMLDKGKVYEVSSVDAKALIQMGKAELVFKKPTKAELKAQDEAAPQADAEAAAQADADAAPQADADAAPQADADQG
jgi:hypothetical protein